MIEPTTPVKPDPVEELEVKLRGEAVESAKKALAELIPLLDLESKTVQRVLRLIETTANIHSELINSYLDGVMPRQRRSGAIQWVNDGNEGNSSNPMIPVDGEPMPAFPAGTDSETFGAQAIGQLMGLAKSITKPRENMSQDIRNLSEALAIATEANLPSNVRSGIEKKLTEALGGAAPPDSLPTAEELMKEVK